jgi:hypothetical protein
MHEQTADQFNQWLYNNPVISTGIYSRAFVEYNLNVDPSTIYMRSRTWNEEIRYFNNE